MLCGGKGAVGGGRGLTGVMTTEGERRAEAIAVAEQANNSVYQVWQKRKVFVS